MRCPDCGEPTTEVRRTVDISPFVQVPEVSLEGARVRVCLNRHENVILPDAQQLERRLLELVIGKAARLNARELRFVRRALSLRSTEAAQLLGVVPEHYSRWENNRAPLTEWADRLIRTVMDKVGAERFGQPLNVNILETLRALTNDQLECCGYTLRAVELDEAATQVRWEGLTTELEDSPRTADQVVITLETPVINHPRVSWVIETGKAAGASQPQRESRQPRPVRQTGVGLSEALEVH